MYANVNAGHAQLFVSRRITASVLAHWQHSAKNTITDSATATPYLPRTESSFQSSCTAFVSPADGTISHIETIIDPDFAEPMLRISIFLSIFNVHVNRVPRTGRVTAVRYFRGEFLDNEEAAVHVGLLDFLHSIAADRKHIAHRRGRMVIQLWYAV